MMSEEYINNNEDQENINIIEQMKQYGLVKPILSETTDIISDPSKIEEQRKKFFDEQFSNSPAAKVSEILQNRDFKSATEKASLMAEKIKNLPEGEILNHLEQLKDIYLNKRALMYLLLQDIAKENDINEIEYKTQTLANLSIQNVILKKAAVQLNMDEYVFSNIKSFNNFVVSNEIQKLSSFSFSKDIGISCPNCGHIIQPKIADFTSLFHKNCNNYIKTLHGKVLIDCIHCEWYFYADIDTVCGIKNVSELLSENIAVKVQSIDKVKEGEIMIRNKRMFLIPYIKETNITEMVSFWKSLFGTETVPGPDESGKFNTETRGVIDSSRTFCGFEFSNILEGYLLVFLYFK